MRAAYDAAQIRAAEGPLLESLPAGTLMQRASRALARRCAQLLGSVSRGAHGGRVYGSRVLLLVGAGNNGADTLWAGAELARRGARVDALLVGTADAPALSAMHAAGGRSQPAGHERDAVMMASADLVVDGMVGIGASGALRAPHARLAGLAAREAGFVVAVDVPSGVDASTGEVAGEAICANVTVTFGAWKIGLLVMPGAARAGVVEVVDIGLSLPPATVLAPEAEDVARLLPDPGAESNKYRRGVVGVVAGSDRYTGAAVLAVGGALAAGAGMVRYVGPERPAALVRAQWPEAVVSIAPVGDPDSLAAAGRVQAWVAGPGLGTDDAALRTLGALCAADAPLLLDADAITVAAANPELLASRRGPTLLTPHAGEFARLVGSDAETVERERLRQVRDAAAALGCVILLKGAATLVADPTGVVRVNTAATPRLATAGAGDVLSGVCGALLAAGLAPADAGAAGAYLHGMAGLIAAGDPSGPITAMEVVHAVPRAIRSLD